MVLPNGLLSYKIIEGKFGSKDYKQLLIHNAIPIIKLNCGDNFYFQEDNSPVHKSKLIKDFMKESEISVLNWPAKSPDLNITEDMWKKISDIVYDGAQYKNKAELCLSIKNAIHLINSSRRHIVIELYRSIRSRLCKILKVNGNLYNSLMS